MKMKKNRNSNIEALNKYKIKITKFLKQTCFELLNSGNFDLFRMLRIFVKLSALLGSAQVSDFDIRIYKGVQSCYTY